MALHSFNDEIAAHVGVNAAILYQNILFWCEKNEGEKSEKHFHEGRYWTFNSYSAFASYFKYLSSKQVRTALELLVKEGYIFEGCFNKKHYDKTKWYSPTSAPQGKTFAPQGKTHAPQGKPIPDSKPDIKPHNNTSSKDDDLDYYLEELWDWYPRKVGKGQAKKALKAALKKVSFDEIYHPLVAYVETLDDKDKQFIPHLATWLNGERWADEE